MDMQILYPLLPDGGFDPSIVNNSENAVADLNEQQMLFALYMMARVTVEQIEQATEASPNAEQKEQWITVMQGYIAEQAIAFTQSDTGADTRPQTLLVKGDKL